MSAFTRATTCLLAAVVLFAWDEPAIAAGNRGQSCGRSSQGGLYGRGNRSRRGNTGYGQTQYAKPAALPATPTVNSKGVDLVLEDLKLVSDATVVAGPAYSVYFRNQGSATAGRFSVTLVASTDGRHSDDSPRATVEVPTLSAGESREVILRLPASVMKMGSEGKPFTHLIVLLDPTGKVIETNETNNSAVVERLGIST